MTDPTVREIQLSRKQLVFGVISAVGVSVVIFLLGVSVGRGVLATSASASAATTPPASSDQAAAQAATPATDVSTTANAPASSGVPGAGAIAMKAAEPPAPPPEVPMPATKADSPKPEPPAKTQMPSRIEPAPKPEAPKATTSTAGTASHASAKPEIGKSQAQPAAQAAHTDWIIQVESFRSKENADRLVTTLKSAGYGAFVLNATGPNTFYRVRIGPFADRVEADKTMSRLVKEGYKPAVQRS